MSASYPIQANFNRGEASPLLRSRVDAEFWKSALDLCENFSVLLQGGIRRRSGTKFVREVKDSTAVSRLLPFYFSNEQSYVLEISGAGTIRYFAQRGVLGAPYETSHAWAAADIADLSYTQFNDLAFFAHADYAPRKLSRLGDTSWTLANAVFKDGPYLAENLTSTSMTPAERGAVTPVMTSNNLPSGTASSSSGATDAWELFDESANTAGEDTNVPGNYAYDLPGTTTKVADAYWLGADEGLPDRMPTNWTFDGWNGSAWITLDVRFNETGWSAGEKRYYEFINTTAYQSYRLRYTSLDGGATAAVAVFLIHESGDTQTPFNLTASSTVGINDGNGFQASDVGRTIRLFGADGRWRWARIAARTSTTVVTIRLYGHALLDRSPITRWALGAFSDYSGYPALTTLFDERLMWARTDAQPVTVWGSKSVDREDYGYSVPLVATDAVNVTLLSADMNELNFIAGDEDLVTGSAKQIRSIGPDDITRGFSALNVRQKKGPSSGADLVVPLSVGGTILYVAAGGRKLRELVMGEQNRYVAPEVSLLGEHAFASGVVTMAFSENPEPTVYVVTENGQLVAMLYDREQRAVGVTRFVFDGVVESLSIIPSQTAGYDDVYLVIRRIINGVSKRFIEVLERPFDHANDDVEDAYFVDCGATYSGAPATVISGLSHLNGEEVVVLADGGVVTGLTVSGGSVTLPYAASTVHIGLAYESRARTLPYAGPGQDGILFGRRVNNVGVYIDLLATGALDVGAYGFDAFEINPHQGDALAGQAVDLLSGFARAEIEGSWATGNGQIELSTSKPLPALIRSVILQAESEP